MVVQHDCPKRKNVFKPCDLDIWRRKTRRIPLKRHFHSIFDGICHIFLCQVLRSQVLKIFFWDDRFFEKLPLKMVWCRNSNVGHFNIMVVSQIFIISVGFGNFMQISNPNLRYKINRPILRVRSPFDWMSRLNWSPDKYSYVKLDWDPRKDKTS